jgi:hypothetical protein
MRKFWHIAARQQSTRRTHYYFVLSDGARKCISQNCFGDYLAFTRALQVENPTIELTHVRERWPHKPIG